MNRIIVSLSALIIMATPALAENAPGDFVGGNELAAAQMCKNFVSDRLKAPSTAKFKPVSEQASGYIGKGRYYVMAEVDAQNSFGTPLKQTYFCTVKDDGNQKWTLVDLKIVP
jgi:hypothetical protein